MSTICTLAGAGLPKAGFRFLLVENLKRILGKFTATCINTLME